MIKKRSIFSSCSIQMYVYAFAGLNGGKQVNSIERIDTKSRVVWELVEVPDWYIHRSLPAISSVSPDTIAILGGSIDGIIQQGGYLLDIRTNEIKKKEFCGGFKKSLDECNIYKRVKENSFFALVIKQDRMREMVRFNQGDSEITWLNVSIKLPTDSV